MDVENPAEKKMRAGVLAEWTAMEVIKREARRAVKSGDVASVDAKKILFEEEDDVVEETEEREEFVVHERD